MDATTRKIKLWHLSTPLCIGLNKLVLVLRVRLELCFQRRFQGELVEGSERLCVTYSFLWHFELFMVLSKQYVLSKKTVV